MKQSARTIADSARASRVSTEAEIAAAPATSIKDCVTKLLLAQRTLGMNHERAPDVQLAEDEQIVSHCFKTALAYLDARGLYAA